MPLFDVCHILCQCIPWFVDLSLLKPCLIPDPSDPLSILLAGSTETIFHILLGIEIDWNKKGTQNVLQERKVINWSDRPNYA